MGNKQIYIEQMIKHIMDLQICGEIHNFTTKKTHYNGNKSIRWYIQLKYKIID